MNIILYHGSEITVGQPIWGKGKKYNDYGLGFYCTENIDVAKEWAVDENHGDIYVTHILDEEIKPDDVRLR